MEGRKTDKARVEEAGRKRRERKEEANDRRGKNNSKNCRRKGI